MMRYERLIVGGIFAILVGVIIAVTQAPFWAEIIALAVLCATVLPWVFLREELLTDRFRLDVHREVLIDGEPYVMTGFSTSGFPADSLHGYSSSDISKHIRINAEFEPTEQYIFRNTHHDIGAP
jgi:hypothetical protein